MRLAIEYGRREGGVLAGAIALARDLMRDDVSVSKVGYSAHSAVDAASKEFAAAGLALSDEDYAELRRAVGLDN